MIGVRSYAAHVMYNSLPIPSMTIVEFFTTKRSIEMKHMQVGTRSNKIHPF